MRQIQIHERIRRARLSSPPRPPSLKLESGDDLALPRRTESCSERVYVSETGGGLTVRVGAIHPRLRLLRVCRTGVIHLRPIKYIREFHPETKTGFLANPKQSSQGQILYWATLVAVIVVIGRSAKLAGSGVCPRGRIERERRTGIETVAVEVLQV